MKLPKRRFQQELVQRFSKDEIRVVCFSLGINHEELDEKTITTLTESLLLYVEKRGRIMDLVKILGSERPQVDWSALAFADMDCPYRGLLPFREEDAHLFFGRDTYTDRLLEAVEKRSLIAVIGSSGSGKSSVVFAGLIPKLRQTGQWQIINFSPGQTPFQALAGELIPFLEPDLSQSKQISEANELSENLVKGKISLHQVMERIVRKLGVDQQILLVIDQFEELYTQTKDTSIQENFTKSLLGLSRIEAVTVLLTIRADFLDRALAYRPFADEMQLASQMIGPMDREELLEVIQRPLSGTFVSFEPGLTTQILNDVGHEPGNLPLLEFALTSLWEEQVDGKLTFTAYEKVGKVGGALTKHAEEVFETFENKEETAQVRRLFIRLVQPVTESVNTRRTAKRSELGEELWRLTPRLASARLIVTGQDENGDETVELAHEALITNWQRFGGWIQEDWEFLAWQERLRANLRQWQNRDNNVGFLLRDAPLVVGKEWLLQRRADLSEPEISFIEASISAEAKRQADEKARRQRELEQAQALAEAEKKRAEEQAQAAKKLRSRAYFLVGALGIAILLAFVAFLSYQDAQRSGQAALASEGTAVAEAANAIAARGTAEAETLIRATAEADAEVRRIEAEQNAQLANEQSQLAFSRQLAAQATTHLDTNNTLAILLSVEAANTDRGIVDESAAIAALREILNAPGLTTSVLDPHTEYEINTVSWDAESSQVVTTFCVEKDQAGICLEGAAYVWNVSNGAVEHMFRHQSSIRQAIWSPGGDKILLITNGTQFQVNQFHIWDLATDEQITVDKAVLDASWSADGTKILVATRGYKAHIWNAQTGEELPDSVFVHSNAVYVARWNESEDRILTSSCQNDTEDDCQGVISIWDVDETKEPVLEITSFDSKVEQAAWSPDDKYILTGDDNGNVNLWSADSGDLVSRDLSIPSNGTKIRFVSWSPDGDRFLAVGQRHVAVWAIDSLLVGETTPLVYFDPYKGQTTSVAWSHDGKWVLVSTLNAAQIWDAQKQTETPQRTLIGHESWVLDAAWSQDDNLIVTAGGDGTARIWKVTSGSELPVFSHTDRILDAALNSQEALLLTGSFDDSVAIWDIEENKLLQSFLPEINNIYSVAWSPDNQLFAAGGYQTVMIWNAYDLAEEPNILSHEINSWIEDILWNQDGSRLLTVSSANNGILSLWDVVNSSEEQVEPIQLIGHEKDTSIYAVAWHPSGKWIASGGEDRTIRFWDTETGQELQKLEHAHSVWHIEWNDAGDTLLATTELGEIELWHLSNDPDLIVEEEPDLIHAHDVRIPFATWNDDENLILSVSVDDSARVWDVETGEQLNLIGHTDDVNWATWNHDESLILTASKDGTARIWDAKTGNELAVLTGHTGSVRQAFWLPDESRIVTYSDDGTVRQYYTSLDALVDVACDLVPRNMTIQEWERFMGDKPYRPSCPNLPGNNN